MVGPERKITPVCSRVLWERGLSLWWDPVVHPQLGDLGLRELGHPSTLRSGGSIVPLPEASDDNIATLNIRNPFHSVHSS